MACTEFHLFPRLSYELRLLIWEAAVRPMGPRLAGIQSITILGRGDLEQHAPGGNIRTVISSEPTTGVDLRHIVAIPSVDHDGRANASAYLWDAGLWKACRESRDTIRRCLDGICETKACDIAPTNHPHQSRGEEQRHNGKFPIVVHTPLLHGDSKEDWLFAVRPGEDAFKPSAEMLLYWSSGVFPVDSSLKFRQDLSLSAQLKDSCKVKNLILEFDPRWNSEWSDDDHRSGPFGLARKTQLSRTFIAYCMVALNFQPFQGCRIWLIDRGDHEIPGYKPRETHPMVFYDCREEYIEVEYGYDCEKNDSAAHFLAKFKNCWDGYFGSRSGSPWTPEAILDVSKYVGILVPRQNMKRQW